MTWGGFLANDWRRQQIGLGVSRCPDDPDAMPPMLVFDVPSQEQVRATMRAARHQRPIVLSGSHSVLWSPR